MSVSMSIREQRKPTSTACTTSVPTGNHATSSGAHHVVHLPPGLLKRYQYLLEIMPDATVIVDRAGRIRVVNQLAEALFGYSREELLGQPIEVLVPERFRVGHEQYREDYTQAPHSRSMGHLLELTSRRKDGSEFPVVASLSPIALRQGGMLVISSIRDISDLQQLRAARDAAETALARALASEARFQRLEQSGIIGITVGDGHTILEANDAFLHMIEYTHEDVIAGAPSWEALAVPDPYQLAATEMAVAEALATGACQPFEKEYVRKDGSQMPALVGLVLLEREPLRLMSIVLDRSDQQRLERERNDAEAHALAVAEVNRHMDEFFVTAAHDIRSPVTALQGNLQVAQRRFGRLQAAALQPEPDLARGVATGPQDGSREAQLAALGESLQMANQSAERLKRVVNLLFDVAQARAGTLTLRPATIDLAQLVRERVEDARAAARGRDIRVELPEEIPVWVAADAERLNQVLANYLNNALKYSAWEKPVIARLEVTGRFVVVSVQDEGPGLSWGEQSRVWEMFHQAPGVTVRSSTSGGLGLGLHICKRIVELHGGRVGVESVEGEGSIFWFSLTLAESPPA